MKNEPTLTNSATDWERIDAMRDEDIDLSDSPELTPEMFAKAAVRSGLKPRPKKVQFTFRLEEDVLAWFRAQGAGYQTQMNNLLRAYMEAQKQQGKLPSVVEMPQKVVRRPTARTENDPKQRQKVVE